MLNIYNYLDAIRARPLMYLKKQDNLHELELLVFGYYAALHQHNINEQVPSLGPHFLDWLRYHKGWSTNQGWAKAVYDQLPEDSSAWDMFFSLVNEYRQLKPRILAQITIAPDHILTSKQVNGVLPAQLFIFQYGPEPLFFLRSIFSSKFVDQNSLSNTPEEVVAIAYQEFRVKSDEWVWFK
jgi:hypothetical protein